MKAMPLIYAVAIAAFIATPVLLQVSSKKNLKVLQQSQDANASGAGQGNGGANGSNLKLEQVNFSTRGSILSNLPTRMRDVIVKPYPWQLGDTSQRFGAVGTLIAYAILLLMIRFGWQSRGTVMARCGPLVYPMLFLLVAYALSAGNAGTGFRYRTHLVTLAVAVMAILREESVRRRAAAGDLAEGAMSRPFAWTRPNSPPPLPNPSLATIVVPPARFEAGDTFHPGRDQRFSGRYKSDGKATDRLYRQADSDDTDMVTT